MSVGGALLEAWASVLIVVVVSRPVPFFLSLCWVAASPKKKRSMWALAWQPIIGQGQLALTPYHHKSSIALRRSAGVGL